MDFVPLVTHSFLEAFPLSSSWHIAAFFQTSSQELSLAQISLLPALIFLAITHQKNLKKDWKAIVLSLGPSGCVFMLEKFHIISFLELDMKWVHSIMGILLMGIATRQRMLSSQLQTLNETRLIAMMNLFQPLALIINGFSRFGSTLLPGLFFKLEWKRTFILSFMLQLMLISADACRFGAQGTLCPVSMMIIGSIVFGITVHFVLQAGFDLLFVIGAYRLFLGFLLIG